MPITVEGPTGESIEFPDGTPQNVMESAMRAHYGVKPPTTSLRDTVHGVADFVDKAGDQFIHGGTLGASDYTRAATRLGLSESGAPTSFEPTSSYNDALKQVRGEDKQFATAHPYVAGGANLAGNIMSPVFGPLFKGVNYGADAIAGLMGTSVPRYLKYALQGGTGGGLMGGLESQGEDGGQPTAGDVGMGVAKGTAGGALLGTAVPAVGEFVAAPILKGIGNVLQKSIDKLPYNQESVAGRKFADILSQDSITPEQLAANRARLGPRANAVDAAGEFDPATGQWFGGKNTYATADSLANIPGQTQNLAERIMKPRPSQSALDLIESAQNHLAPGSYHDTFDTLNAQQQKLADPFYKEAFAANKSVGSPVIDRILKTPAGEDALAYARNRMQNKLAKMAVPDPELTEQLADLVARGEAEPVKGGVASGLKLETLDLIKQGLQEQEGALKKRILNGTAKPSEASDIGDLRRSFTSELDKYDATAKAGPNSTKAEGGAYARARATWADKADLKDALKAGRDFMKGDREIVASDFNDLSPSEQQMFRLGAARTIQGTLEQTGTVPGSLKNILNPANKQRSLMTTVFPHFENFLSDVGGVARRLEAVKMIGGSPTAGRLANTPDLGGDLGGAAIQMAQGHYGGGLLNAVKGIGDWLNRPSKGAQDQLGRWLVDPGSFDEGMAALKLRAQVRPMNVGGLLDASPRVSMGLLSPWTTGGSNQ